MNQAIDVVFPSNNVAINFPDSTISMTLGQVGPVGPQGLTGATGATGAGVPTGGTTGQVLSKNSATNYDTGWETLATVATTGSYSSLSGLPTLGTLAALNSIDLTANVGSTVLPIANGGTGSSTQNFVDLSITAQTKQGSLTLGNNSLSTQASLYLAGINGGASLQIYHDQYNARYVVGTSGGYHVFNATLQPNTNNTTSLGASSAYWQNIYGSRLYLNSTAYLDGSTAGNIAFSNTYAYTSQSYAGIVNYGGSFVYTGQGFTLGEANGNWTVDLLLNTYKSTSTTTNDVIAIKGYRYATNMSSTYKVIGVMGTSHTYNLGVGNTLAWVVAVAGYAGGTQGSLLGTVTNSAAFYARASDGGASTNAYGLYVEAVTLATNNYAIYTNTGLVRFGDVMLPVQATTTSAPTYVKGGVYFDTTLNKLRIGGASGWETVTSS